MERAVIQQGRYPEASEALLRSSFRLGSAMIGAEPDGHPDGNTDGDSDGNTVTSPLSALYALAMLRAGAGTTTATEMDEALALPPEYRDEALNALLASVEQFDGDPGSVDEENPPQVPLLHLANAVFVSEDKPVGAGFLDTLAQHYGAGVYPVDFADAATGKQINDWVSQETGGRIDEAPLEVNARTVLTLLNTVYFAAAWEVPFDPENTDNQEFTLRAGGAVSVPMMQGSRLVRYAEGTGWRGIDLPYGKGFFMRLVLPVGTSTPTWSEDELVGIARVLDAAEPQEVAVELPTWDHEYTQDLLRVLRPLGLEETFGSAPDFEAIHPGAQITGGAQTANITVAEKGTIAAAVTQFAMEASAQVPPALSISFDRPFGYQIIHEETGLPVFLGTVADPR